MSRIAMSGAEAGSINIFTATEGATVSTAQKAHGDYSFLTDAAASSSVAEDTTARTGISLFKGIKNILILLNAKMPSLGQKTKAGSLSVTLSSDEDTLGVSGPLTDAEMRASDVAVTLDGEKVLVDEDSLPASLTETTVTVAQNESESGEFDLGPVRAQAFAGGIVWAVIGDWANVKQIEW